MNPDDRQHASDMVTLREYIEAIFAQYQEHHKAEHAFLAENIERAQKVVDERLAGMNKLKDQILSERGEFEPRRMSDARWADLEKGLKLEREAEERRFGVLETALANLRGRMTATAAAITVGLIILELFLRFVVKV